MRALAGDLGATGAVHQGAVASRRLREALPGLGGRGQRGKRKRSAGWSAA